MCPQSLPCTTFFHDRVGSNAFMMLFRQMRRDPSRARRCVCLQQSRVPFHDHLLIKASAIVLTNEKLP